MSFETMIRQVASGERKLDVPTAQSIITQATEDGRIEISSELRVLRDLFVGGSVHNDYAGEVRGTTSGKRLLRGFVLNAEQLHADVGNARSERVAGLKALSVQYTTDLLSRENVLELISQYRGAVAPDPGYPASHSTGSIDVVTPEVVEKWRQKAVERYTKYLEGGPVRKFFMRLIEGNHQLDHVYENNPADYLRIYLEYYGTRKPPEGTVPLDEQVKALEVSTITEALNAAGHDVAAAAVRLGMSESSLRHKMREYGIAERQRS